MRALPLFALLLATPAQGQSGFVDRTLRGEPSTARAGDPAMARAIGAARGTLDRFLTLARAPGPGMSGFAVKVRVTEGDETEYFWISPFEQGERFSGRVDNRPVSLRGLSQGQAIRFGKRDIVDWYYYENGRMRGAYTICAMLTHEPPEAAAGMRARFGLACPPQR